mgnify:CR=1 FL=1
MQDSSAVHKIYTLAFNIQKEIATSKLNYYLVASIRATLGTRYPENIYQYPASYVA